MKNGITELVFILDRSGSMAGLESDTIGGFNAMLEKQKKQEGKCWVSTILFENASTVLHDRLPLEQVPPMTDEDYCVGGCTALLDAVGGAIHHVANIHKYARPEDVPEHTLFVITTDGMENASRSFTAEKVKQMIEKEKREYGWEFIFLGANIDAVQTAARMGISEDRAANYVNDGSGVGQNFDAVSDVVHSVRACGCVPSAALNKVRKDYAARSKKR